MSDTAGLMLCGFALLASALLAFLEHCSAEYAKRKQAKQWMREREGE